MSPAEEGKARPFSNLLLPPSLEGPYIYLSCLSSPSLLLCVLPILWASQECSYCLELLPVCFLPAEACMTSQSHLFPTELPLELYATSAFLPPGVGPAHAAGCLHLSSLVLTWHLVHAPLRGLEGWLEGCEEQWAGPESAWGGVKWVVTELMVR